MRVCCVRTEMRFFVVLWTWAIDIFSWYTDRFLHYRALASNWPQTPCEFIGTSKHRHHQSPVTHRNLMTPRSETKKKWSELEVRSNIGRGHLCTIPEIFATCSQNFAKCCQTCGNCSVWCIDVRSLKLPWEQLEVRARYEWHDWLTGFPKPRYISAGGAEAPRYLLFS